MTSDEFAKNFYIEKLNFLKSCFQVQPDYPSAVNTKIKKMALSSTQKEQLEEVMKNLTEREAMVLKLRFGLDNGKGRTLEEVGKVFNVTRERIRQIEAKALKKLGVPKLKEKLQEYMN